MTTALEQLKAAQVQLQAAATELTEQFGLDFVGLEHIKEALREINTTIADIAVETENIRKEAEEVLDTPVYKDISGMTIEQIRRICNEWRSTLKPGDSVLVMSALVGWSDSDCNFTTTVKTATPKRLVLSDDCCTIQKIFHRDGGRILNGVSGYGDWLLMPPFLNPKDLQEIRTAAETVARRTLLDNVPASKLQEVLELLKPYQ